MSAHSAFGAVSDAALDTLLLPFVTGVLPWPDDGRVLFMQARAGLPLSRFASPGLICEQDFRPFADALERSGLRMSDGTEKNFGLVLLLPPRQREQARALLARALQRTAPGGVLVASMLNTEGARSGEADLQRLAGNVQSLSKNKCRVFWTVADPVAVDSAQIAEWASLDAPRPIAEGRFLSRPGLFAWDRIDAASKLLAEHLPTDLAGHGADLGAGFGYLSAEILVRCPQVVALDLYEAQASALALARQNLAQQADRAALDFYWHDVTTGLPHRYDFIVSNPPFHQGRADQPELGMAFIIAAAAALQPGGRLWLVANRHLPYEQVLAKGFAAVRTVIEQEGFKVIEAVKARV